MTEVSRECDELTVNEEAWFGCDHLVVEILEPALRPSAKTCM